MRVIAWLLIITAWGGLAFAVGPELLVWQRAKSWQAAEATLVAVTPGSNSPTGQMIVAYRYQAQGGLHEGSRVFLGERWRPDGEILARLEKRFTTNFMSERPMRLWVNPGNPDEAVLFRDMDWSVTFPVWMGTGLLTLAGIALLVWRSRHPVTPEPAVSVPTPVAPRIPPRPVAIASKPVPPSSLAAHAPGPAVAAGERRISLQRATEGLCMDLRVSHAEALGIESATLDRIDSKGILRWQDGLRINVLSSKPVWYVRCPLPSQGPAIAQARDNPQDSWQVTFRVKTPTGPQRWSEPLPDQWWT